MAYSREMMIESSLKAIQDNNLIWIEEIFAFVPFSQKTFYNHELQELQEIKKAIDDNRVRQKQKMRKKWYDSDNPTLQLAAYKLLGTDLERDILNTQKIDHSNKGKEFDFSNTPSDELITRLHKLLATGKEG